jgi:hypothetical protein
VAIIFLHMFKPCLLALPGDCLLEADHGRCRREVSEAGTNILRERNWCVGRCGKPSILQGYALLPGPMGRRILPGNHLNPLTLRKKISSSAYDCEAVGDLFRALQSCAIIRQQGL